MTRYTDDSKERVRDAVEMVDLVGTRTGLRRAGVNRYEGLCPFHDERTPSFGIDPAQKLFYCFGCGEGATRSSSSSSPRASTSRARSSTSPTATA